MSGSRGSPKRSRTKRRSTDFRRPSKQTTPGILTQESAFRTVHTDHAHARTRAHTQHTPHTQHTRGIVRKAHCKETGHILTIRHNATYAHIRARVCGVCCVCAGRLLYIGGSGIPRHSLDWRAVAQKVETQNEKEDQISTPHPPDNAESEVFSDSRRFFHDLFLEKVILYGEVAVKSR